MTDPMTMSDHEFLTAFLDCSMPASGFDHRGHVRAAWLMLRCYPEDEAAQRTCDGIARLATHLGVPGKYHRTLTEALVRLMAHGGAADHGMSWNDFVHKNRLLMEDARGLLARHYSEQTLGSPDARKNFVPPDRLPLNA
jgi:hypothetical protein